MEDDLRKTSWKHGRPFRLGEWEVRPASGELQGRRGAQRLRPLLMDILLRLSAQPGEVVARETLLEDVWPRRMVNDEVLSRAIAELRTALGDDARGARYIETLPKLGYRLVAEVSFPVSTPAGGGDPVAQAPGTRTPGRMRPWWMVFAALALVIAAGAAVHFREAARPATGDLERMLLNARPLTSDPQLELNPRFSPDGRRIAFALSDGNNARIVVQAVDGSSRQVVGGDGPGLRLSPAFFPDGKRIAYWRGGDECGIVEHDLSTGAERSLVECAAVPRSRFDLSRDGRWIVYSAATRPQFPAGLQLREVGGASKPLTSPEPGAGDDLFPRFSPDGRRIAFFRGSESHRALWTIDRESAASARAVTALEGLSYGVAWMGAEGPLLVAADWFGFRALNVVELATGSARLAGARGARFPDAGPAGEVVFESAVYTANLWRVAVDGSSAPASTWPSTRYTNQAEFSPDGAHVAFASNREGFDGIYVAAFGAEPRRIAGAESHRFIRPHWSSDGRSIYAVRIAAGAAGTAIQEAVRIPRDGGEIEVLSALGQAVNDVRQSRDGRWIYWAELSGYAMRLLRSPTTEPGKSERLPWPLVSQYQMNAERIVFAQPQLSALTTCRLVDLACEPLGIDIAPYDLYHWALGSKSLWMPTGQGAERRIARVDLGTRSVVATVPFAPSGAGTSIAASPDESTLLVVRETGPAIDLMIARP